jgi:hypothetical protein
LFKTHRDTPDYYTKVVEQISIPIFVPKNSPTFLVSMGQRVLECMVFNINAIFVSPEDIQKITDYSMSRIGANNSFQESLPEFIEENTSKKGNAYNELNI